MNDKQFRNNLEKTAQLFEELGKMIISSQREERLYLLELKTLEQRIFDFCVNPLLKRLTDLKDQ